MTANAQLQSFIDRIERLVTEREAISADIAEVKQEAKSSGFDLPTINRLLKLRKLSDQERKEQEELLESYEASLGALKDTPLGDAAMERAEKGVEKLGEGDAERRPADEIPEKIEEAKAVLLGKDPRAGGRLSGCTSYVQRKMGLGYNVAARILEKLERTGFISTTDKEGYRTITATVATTSVVPPEGRIAASVSALKQQLAG